MLCSHACHLRICFSEVSPEAPRDALSAPNPSFFSSCSPSVASGTGTFLSSQHTAGRLHLRAFCSAMPAAWTSLSLAPLSQQSHPRPVCSHPALPGWSLGHLDTLGSLPAPGPITSLYDTRFVYSLCSCFFSMGSP